MYIGNRINLFVGIGLIVFGIVIVISGSTWGLISCGVGIASIASALISHTYQKRVRIKKNEKKL